MGFFDDAIEDAINRIEEELAKDDPDLLYVCALDYGLAALRHMDKIIQAEVDSWG